MLWKIVFGVVLAIAHQFCYCDEHTYGSSNAGDKILFEKVLFDQVKEESVAQSKNYTLIFKYMGSESSTNLTHAVFNVKNAVSIGCCIFKTQFIQQINSYTIIGLTRKATGQLR